MNEVQAATQAGIYQTQDLYLAAALVAGKADYLGTSVRGPGRVYFRFADSGGSMADQEQLYYRHRMKPIQPQVYVQALQRVRDDLRDARKG